MQARRQRFDEKGKSSKRLGWSRGDVEVLCSMVYSTALTQVPTQPTLSSASLGITAAPKLRANHADAVGQAGASQWGQ